MILIRSIIRVISRYFSRASDLMYVCVCNALTEGEVRQAIDEGALTTCQLRKKLDAERVCGSCDDCLEDYLAEAFMFASPSLRTVAVK